MIFPQLNGSYQKFGKLWATVCCPVLFQLCNTLLARCTSPWIASSPSSLFRNVVSPNLSPWSGKGLFLSHLRIPKVLFDYADNSKVWLAELNSVWWFLYLNSHLLQIFIVKIHRLEIHLFRCFILTLGNYWGLTGKCKKAVRPWQWCLSNLSWWRLLC